MTKIFLRIVGAKYKKINTARDALEFSKQVKVIELEVSERVIRLITQKVGKITEKIFNLIGIKLPQYVKEIKVEEFTYQKGVQKELFY